VSARFFGAPARTLLPLLSSDEEESRSHCDLEPFDSRFGTGVDVVPEQKGDDRALGRRGGAWGRQAIQLGQVDQDRVGHQLAQRGALASRLAL
jgi:hypothetical protein